MSVLERVKNAWNAFNSRDPTQTVYLQGNSYSERPDRARYTNGVERSIVTSLYTRIAIDAASMNMQHVRVDANNRFVEEMRSGLNNCLTVSANLDQTGRAFIQDAIITMLDKGHVCVVPVETDIDPRRSETYKIISLRAGHVVTWYPDYVKVRLYNEKKAMKEDILLPKKAVAIVENPFYSVMNDTNSTLQRLIHKLNLLDVIDDQSGDGKMNLIIQVPYAVKTQTQKALAEERRSDLEKQLRNSKYGIAYADGTEKIVQLNRSIENNLLNQVEFLTSMLYSQLGMSKEILEGSANDQTMLNYYNGTVAVILTALANEFERKFLTKTARSQGQRIMFFRDPFKLVPVEKLAEISDKLTRNAILSSNEVRQTLGYKPSDDPDADALRNKNITPSDQELAMQDAPYGEMDYPDEETYQQPT